MTKNQRNWFLKLLKSYGQKIYFDFFENYKPIEDTTTEISKRTNIDSYNITRKFESITKKTRGTFQYKILINGNKNQSTLLKFWIK